MSIFGNISKAGSYYNKKNKILYVRGWFLDANAYDKIMINGSDAVIGIERQDVHNNFKEYSPNCGFEFWQKTEDFSGKITIDILLNEEIVYSKEYDVPIVEFSLDKNRQKTVVLLGVDESIERLYYLYRDSMDFKFFIPE